jgi:hypothetical protein
MTTLSDPKEDAQMIERIIAGLAEQGLEGFEGVFPGTLCLKVGEHTVRFLRLETAGYINFDQLWHTTKPGCLILGPDVTRRSKTAKKVLEVVRTLRYRHRIMLRDGLTEPTP